MTVVVTHEIFVHGPRLGAVIFHTKLGGSGNLYSRPLRPCSILRPPSTISLYTNHINAFLLYFTLPLCPADRMRPMVSGLSKRLRNTLMHMDAIVMASRKTSKLHIWIKSLVNTRHACRKTDFKTTRLHLGNKLTTRACYRPLAFYGLRTRREILSSPLRASRPLRNTRHRG